MQTSHTTGPVQEARATQHPKAGFPAVKPKATPRVVRGLAR